MCPCWNRMPGLAGTLHLIPPHIHRTQTHAGEGEMPPSTSIAVMLPGKDSVIQSLSGEPGFRPKSQSHLTQSDHESRDWSGQTAPHSTPDTRSCCVCYKHPASPGGQPQAPSTLQRQHTPASPVLPPNNPHWEPHPDAHRGPTASSWHPSSAEALGTGTASVVSKPHASLR